MSCFRIDCPKKATHDLAYNEVHARDEDARLIWLEEGKPNKVPGVLHVSRGTYGCRAHVFQFANHLNERRQPSQQSPSPPAPRS